MHKDKQRSVGCLLFSVSTGTTQTLSMRLFVGVITAFNLICFVCAAIIPDVTIRAFTPKGLEVSIPAVPGLNEFIFNANVNRPIFGKDDGSVSGVTRRNKNGKFEIILKDVRLDRGDTLYYWVSVDYENFGYDKYDLVFEVEELLNRNCIPTKTVVNGIKLSCGNKLIFQDDFNHFNISNWRMENYIPLDPDFEFNSYEKNYDNVYVENNQMHIRPTIRNNPESGDLVFSNGCTSERKTQICRMSVRSTILPPAISGQITSKLSFMYGKVEVIAQMPMGDWIYPQLYLEPHKYYYGDMNYESGRIWLGYARGNVDLQHDGNDIGNNLLQFGCVLGKRDPVRYIGVKSVKGQSWSSNPHNFTLIWTPEKITFFIDGSNEFDALPPGGRFSSLSSLNISYASRWNEPNAPFDREFVLRLGVGVGGMVDFPDNSFSSHVEKPWRNTSPRAALNFYQHRDTWRGSWTNAVLKIKSVKIWSL